MNVRALRPEDLDEVLVLSRAADEAVWNDSDWTEQDLRELWDELDLERDAWAVEVDGRIAGWGTFEARGERTIGDGYVHPDLQGRGVGAQLVRLYEARAANAPGARTIESAALRGDGSADALFRSRGFAPVRHFFRMLIEHDREPEPPVWPYGVEAAPFDLADAEAFHAALNEAFAEEWGFAAEPFKTFRERRLGAERFDPGVCWVAKERGEIVALSLNDWKRNGDWGWIGSLAVRPAWRRRGLGEALLRASFGEFWRRGERRVALGVDSQNPTGATRLYERVGMRVLWEAIVYRKAVGRG
jgi:ribosomal protein S18 acetylase RimI-like enzyme